MQITHYKDNILFAIVFTLTKWISKSDSLILIHEIIRIEYDKTDL